MTFPAMRKFKITLLIFFKQLIVTLLLNSFFLCCFVSADELLDSKEIKIGVYLTSLYDIDTRNGQFSADIWLWSKSLEKAKYNHKLLEIKQTNIKFPIGIFGEYTETIGPQVFASKKIQGIFINNFDLSKYPFDRQILKITFESTDTTKNVRFISDSDIGFDSLIQTDGWKINSIKLVPNEHNYKSNFGYPYSSPTPPLTFSQITLLIEIERKSPFLFIKLVLGLLIAVFIAFLSLVLTVNNDDLFTARLSLIVVALLAAVFNQQYVSSIIGETTDITIVDSVHLLGILLIGIVFLHSIILRIFSVHSNFPSIRLKRYGILDNIDIGASICLFLIFIGVTTILILQAY